MFSSKRGLPLIQNERGVAVPFENDWLKAAVETAARKAGYDRWWLLDDFGAAVSLYLRHSYHRKVIDLRSLESVIRSALREIGYREIALRFRLTNPFQHVSLATYLKGREANQPTVFFKKLSQRIAELHAAEVRHLHFYDLHHCVQRLRERDQTVCHWNDPLLRERIVCFVRDRMQSLPWKQSVHCSIS